MNLDKIHNIYFLGIGGIGMSAIARYFNTLGKNVAGYDKVSRPLTETLQSEGIVVNFDSSIEFVPEKFKNKENTLIVITPAIPKSHNQLNYFIQQGFSIKKRSEILGLISETGKCIAVAGTHGKTTITTMIAYFMHQSRVGCNAFLGGVSKNFGTNLLVNPHSGNIVVEADEFDRSFLQLQPQNAIISVIDADHLDIYKNKNSVHDAFKQFVHQMKTNGTLIIKSTLSMDMINRDDINVYTYSLKGDADFRAENIRIEEGLYVFDFIGDHIKITDLKLGLPGLINVENAVAAIAMAYFNGVHKDEICNSVPKFKGIERRFDYQINRDDFVYIDDYAHHPEELKAAIGSVRALYKDKKITGIFQPHLYSRTRDFAGEFARSLELLDEIILLDIYPAREKPLPGITSEIIFEKINKKEKIKCNKDDVVDYLKNNKPEVLITLGAGDIDELVKPIKKIFE